MIAVSYDENRTCRAAEEGSPLQRAHAAVIMVSPNPVRRSAPLFKAQDMRNVEGMRKLFDAIRNTGFRRGPDRVLGGISGSLARSTGLNVWLVRLLVLASFLLPVLGIGAYLVAWVLTPWQDGSIPIEQAFGGRLER